MLDIKKILSFSLLFVMIIFTGCSSSQNKIAIHYLGHSSFFLDFNGEISVLCDYGKENAYLEWGWDSPIYDAGEPGPDIIAYSHHHDDHYDPERAAHYHAVRIDGFADTTIGRLTIKSFESSEKDISRYDNVSYLFEYGDMRVLHLGDCQADIMMINDPAHAWNLEQRYPKGCDIVIMPIEGTQKYLPQAVKMAELLEPKVLIPTHYWSNEYKQEFIDQMIPAFSKKNKVLNIDNFDGSEFLYHKNKSKEDLTIPMLKPSARETG
jgi:L-ascorbate metabolism protein UlaG (beta-lactamase superfamily)